MILTDWRLLRNLVPSRLAVAPTTRRRRLQNPGHVAAAIQDGSEQRLVALRRRAGRAQLGGVSSNHSWYEAIVTVKWSKKPVRPRSPNDGAHGSQNQAGADHA